MFYPKSKMFSPDPYPYIDLRLFLRGPQGFPKSQWIWIEDKMEIFFRRSTRIVEGKMVEFVDLANIRTDEENQGKGIFTRLLDWLYLDQKRNIYVENVHNEVLAEKLVIKWGFSRMDLQGYENCFYKLQK